MKNLKLLNIQKKLNIEADSFCLDYDENTYFASINKIYCVTKGSYDISLCTDITSEVDESYTLIGIEHIIETDKLFIASSSGEIYLYDVYSKEVSTVGIVDSKVEGFAWSPDQEFLVLLTGANTLILMTKDFDPITEKSLCPDEFGENKPITVGWGSKETQFHGSEGKDAAKVRKMEAKPALPYDDGRPRISWRGDGEYFVTSSIHSSKGFRQLRIWSREAVLQFTGEIKDGLEEPVCWRPLGNLIACSQQDSNKHKIIFFEKNGLQHGEFALPFKQNTHKVTHLLWNTDSTILLIAAELIEDPSVFEVMLWTCGNYHWYLKQKFSLQKTDPQKSLIIKWSSQHPHEVFFLNQTTQNFYEAKWTWTISSSVSESEDAIVASIDNDNILITPFGNMVVPPPMCAYSCTFPSTVQSVCFAPKSPEFCCYLGDFKLAFFQRGNCDEGIKPSDESKTKLVAAGGNGFISKVGPYNFRGIFKFNLMNGLETHEFGFCHWTWVKGNKLLCVCSYLQNTVPSFALILFELPEILIPEKELLGRHLMNLESSVTGICTDRSGSVVAIQLTNRKILKLDIDKATSMAEGFLVPWLCDDGSHLTLPQACICMSIISIHGKDYFLGLTERFTMYCNKSVLLSNCTSYYIHEEYLLATTTDHLLKFFLIDWDLADLNKSQLDSNVQIQRIEKGAKIIIAPLSGTKVILQMPRGNLETINPRPLVLSCVCKHLDNLQFDKTFELSKVHRIDLNILYDHNPKGFLDNVQLVVEQLKSSTNLNLFLASLKNEDICETLYSLAYKGKTRPVKPDLESNKIDIVCHSIREVLEAKKDDKLFLTLIATYAKKSEPELEQALIRLKGVKDSNRRGHQALVDSALNFLLYLVDVNELIDVALGTYDLEITIMVAQKSQKDPKEFLPFYNELQRLEENYRKYKIDMHLRRYKLALEHISKCEDQFDKCLELIRDQRLYKDSLYLFPTLSDRYKVVWKEYGGYLMDKRYFDDAGLIFVKCEHYEKALEAYMESLNWQSLLSTAMQLSYSDDQIIALCIEAVDKLKSNQKYVEASYLLEQYVKDTEESIVTLIEGYEWDTAFLLMSKHNRHDIIETHLKPALLEHYLYLETHIEQLYKDFTTHTERLKVVRSQKQKEAELPDIIKHHDEELFSETDSVADIASSCAESKQLSGSIMTRKSSKSRRKQKLKKYRLKEGSPDEDLALIAALSEIVVKIDNLRDTFKSTLKILILFGNDEQAKFLQQEMTKLVTTVESELPNIWLPGGKDSQTSEMKFGPDSTANSIVALLQSEKNNPTNSPTEDQMIRDQRLHNDSSYFFHPLPDRYKIVWKEFGSHLMDKQCFDDAGLIFFKCEEYKKALEAYMESRNWKSMLSTAMQLSYSDDQIIALCIEAADKLKSNQKYVEASHLLEQYVKDIEGSIVTLIEGYEWDTALLLMSKYNRRDIIETHLKPALLEHYLYLETHIEQLSKDFMTHTKGLKIVRSQKQKEAELPDIIKHHDEELFSETDSVADVASCAESEQLSGSIMARNSSKSSEQKLEQYCIKEGSSDEDLAHIAALSKIVVKIDNLKDNFKNTLKILVLLGNDEQARFLQQEMTKLVTTVESEIPNIWLPGGKDSQNSEMKFGPDSTANSITALLQSEKKNPTNTPTDPGLTPPPWRNIDVSLQMFKQCI